MPRFRPFIKKSPPAPSWARSATGYTLGIVGISLNHAMEPLGLTSFWMGLIGAGSMFGIFFGSLLAGITADKIGRRPLYASLMLLTAIVSVLQFFLSDPLLIAIVRFVLGMLIGADYTVGIPLLSGMGSGQKNARASWGGCWSSGPSAVHFVYCRLFHGRFCRRLWQRRLASRALHFRCAQPDRPRHPLPARPESPLWHIAKGALRKLSPTSMPISATSMDCLIAERKSPLPLRGSRPVRS